MNYYYLTALTRHGFNGDNYIFADTAAEAISKFRLGFEGEFVSVSARRVVYGEWRESLTIGGDRVTR